MRFGAKLLSAGLASLLVTACGGGAKQASNLQTQEPTKVAAGTGTADTTAPSLMSFSPAGGTYATLPTLVTIQFSEEMDMASAQMAANWSIVCTHGTFQPSSVTLVSDIAYLNSADIGNTPDGGQCILTASANLRDKANNFITGNRTVTYVRDSGAGGGGGDTDPPTGSITSPLQRDRLFGPVTFAAVAADLPGPFGVKKVEFYLAGVLLGSDTTFPYEVTFNTASVGNGLKRLHIAVEDMAGNRTEVAHAIDVDIQNHDVTELEYVGGNGGNAFSESSNQRLLYGFHLRTGSVVDRIQAVWRSAYGTPSDVLGAARGGSGGSAKTITCPAEEKYRVVGIYGRDGSLVDRLGVICKSMNGAGGTYYSPAHGGNGGSYFEMMCPAGKFVKEIRGRTGGKVDRLQLVCQ